MTGTPSRHVALVTGGARGIGRAIVRRLREDGAHLAVFDRDPLDGPDDDAVAWWGLDVTDHAAVAGAVAEVAARLGPISTLVNNAGVLDARPAAEVTPEAWQRVMRVNLEAVFFVAQAVLAHLADGASIVNIASTSAFVTGRQQAVYEASKAGVVMLTRSLAVELAPRVRVNAVAPGLVDTPMTRGLFGTKERFDARVTEKVPLGRAAQPSDIADAVAFLASDEAAYVTGETLVVDGGWMLP